MRVFVCILVCVTIFFLGVAAGAILNHWREAKELQKMKDSIPECTEPVKVYYL